jgi:hypothetical protein
MLQERIYLLLGLLLVVPATVVYFVLPLWRAHREQRAGTDGPRVGRAHFVFALAVGTVGGWVAFRLLPESQFLGVIAGLMLAVIALAWYLAISANAFQFGAWHPIFGFGRPVPTEMAKPIQAPFALRALLFLAGGLLGLILHMLSVSGA